MARKKRIGECAYCGNVAELTDDHVIPKCLFQRPLPSNPVKAPACFPCNNEKSKTDDYLRDFLVLDAYASDHKIAQALFRDKMISSVRQNSSALAKTALSKSKPHSVYSPGGIYIGDVLSFPIEAKGIFSRIARGLYYNIQRKRIPDDYIFTVTRPEPQRLEEIMAHFVQLPHLAFRVGDHGEFISIFVGSTADPFTMIWLLWFYESICISVEVDPPPKNHELNAGATEQIVGRGRRERVS